MQSIYVNVTTIETGCKNIIKYFRDSLIPLQNNKFVNH